MDGHSAHGVVNAKDIVEKPHAEYNQHTGDTTDDNRAQAIGNITGGGNGHEACQGSIQTHGNIGLAVLDPGEDHTYHGCYGGGHGGGQENGAQLFDGSCRGTVEAVPAQPEDENTKSAQRNAMAREGVHFGNFAGGILCKLADTGSEQFGADQGGDAANHVDGAGAGEIVEAELSEPAAAPDPVGFNGINQCGNHTGIDAVGQEFSALCHGTGDDGGCGGTEHQIKYKAGKIEFVIGGEQIKAGLANKAEKIFAHQKAEANDNEYHGADAEVHEVFHNDVAGIFGTGKTGLNHGKSCLHPKNQCRSNQEPYTPYFTHNLTSLQT